MFVGAPTFQHGVRSEDLTPLFGENDGMRLEDIRQRLRGSLHYVRHRHCRDEARSIAQFLCAEAGLNLIALSSAELFADS